jgi:hypothetical protein
MAELEVAKSVALWVNHTADQLVCSKVENLVWMMVTKQVATLDKLKAEEKVAKRGI